MEWLSPIREASMMDRMQEIKALRIIVLNRIFLTPLPQL